MDYYRYYGRHDHVAEDVYISDHVTEKCLPYYFREHPYSSDVEYMLGRSFPAPGSRPCELTKHLRSCCDKVKRYCFKRPNEVTSKDDGVAETNPKQNGAEDDGAPEQDSAGADNTAKADNFAEEQGAAGGIGAVKGEDCSMCGGRVAKWWTGSYCVDCDWAVSDEG